MRIPHRLPPLAATQIGMHHLGLDRARADEGNLDHQVGEAARLEPGNHVRLGPAFHLEDPHRLSPAEHIVHLRVIPWERVQSGPLPRPSFDHGHGVLDGGQHPQPQQVDLDHPNPLQPFFIPLGDDPAGHRSWLQRHQFAQRRPGEDHSSVVDPQVTRDAVQLRHDAQEVLEWFAFQAAPRTFCPWALST